MPSDDCLAIKGNGKWSEADCIENKPFVCEIENACAGSHSSPVVHMKSGDVRYFELIGYNNDNLAHSLLTLTINEKTANQTFRTSEVRQSKHQVSHFGGHYGLHL